MKKRYLYDALLVLVLISVSFVLYFVIRYGADSGGAVRVSVGEDPSIEYPLSRDASYSLNGGTNILIIEGGEAFIKEADCPDGLCIRQGRISRVGERIVCLPNKILVEVID